MSATQQITFFFVMLEDCRIFMSVACLVAEEPAVRDTAAAGAERNARQHRAQHGHGQQAHSSRSR